MRKCVLVVEKKWFENWYKQIEYHILLYLLYHKNIILPTSGKMSNKDSFSRDIFEYAHAYETLYIIIYSFMKN